MEYYKCFDELLAACSAQHGAKPLAVVCAEDANTLETAAHALEQGVADPILIGEGARMEVLLAHFPALSKCRRVQAADGAEAAQRAVELVHRGQAAAILKGHVETAVIMHAVVRPENGLCASGVMSHLTLLGVPGYHKLLGITDGALIPHPDLEKKRLILHNAADYLHRLGYGQLRIGALAAVEQVSPKMPETVDAAALAELGRSGEFGGDIVEGPISYDLAVQQGAAALKNFDSRVAGNVDLLLVPDLTVGNVLIKSLTCSAGAKGAGVIIGAKVPIIVTSRASAAQAKYRSVALALLAADR